MKTKKNLFKAAAILKTILIVLVAFLVIGLALIKNTMIQAYIDNFAEISQSLQQLAAEAPDYAYLAEMTAEEFGAMVGQVVDGMIIYGCILIVANFVLAALSFKFSKSYERTLQGHIGRKVWYLVACILLGSGLVTLILVILGLFLADNPTGESVATA